MRSATCLCLVLLVGACLSEAKRSSFGGSRSRGGGYSSGSRRTQPPPRRTQPPPSRPKPSSSGSDTFLNAERGSSSTHHRGSQYTPSAPPSPPHTNHQTSPSGSQPQHTNGPIGFEGLGNSNNKGNQRPLGFDNVNSQVQNKPPANPPPYQGGPPPVYPGSTGNTYGSHDHPPAYPGRPVNAPPAYQPNNPQAGAGNNYPGHSSYPNQQSSYPGQHGSYPNQQSSYPGQHGSYPNQQSSYPGQHGSYPNQQSSYPGQHSSYPNQQSSYPGQHGSYPNQQNTHPGQYNSYPNQHNSYPGQYNPFPGQYNPYPGQQGFGGGYHSGSYSPYPGSNGYYGNSYPGYGGSPFGGGYNGNPYYSSNNFGYSGYPGQYQKQSRFGGLPIPIPIPIPIGGGGLFGDHHSYTHNVLDRFIKSKTANSTGNSTDVFLLNNSTVAPCTTDHFVYDLMKVTVVSCTAEHCTAIKVSAHTNTTKETVHSASITMCLENNVTVTTHGKGVVPSVSPITNETTTLCRDIPNNVTLPSANSTLNASEEAKSTGSTTEPTTTELPTTTETMTTTVESTASTNTTNTTRLCETVKCSTVQMCLPTIEVVDQCNSLDCPFRRTGYTSCVTLKMCQSPTVAVSSTATLNNTVSKIDEYNRYNSVHDVVNLTLISYHRPVIVFNCTQNVSAPGCRPPLSPTPTTADSTSTPPTTMPTTAQGTDSSSGSSAPSVAGHLFPAMAGPIASDTSTSPVSDGQTTAPNR